MAAASIKEKEWIDPLHPVCLYTGCQKVIEVVKDLSQHLCSTCDTVYYCSRRCEIADFPEHKKVCHVKRAPALQADSVHKHAENLSGHYLHLLKKNTYLRLIFDGEKVTFMIEMVVDQSKTDHGSIVNRIASRLGQDRFLISAELAKGSKTADFAMHVVATSTARKSASAAPAAAAWD